MIIVRKKKIKEEKNMDVKEMIDTHLILLHARTSLETDKKIFLEAM